MCQVVLSQVSSRYPGGICGVAGIDLEISAGELFVVVGASGAGKTTLARLVCGLERPTAGTIRLGGEEITHMPAYRRGVGYVSQRALLYPHLSVANNLRFGIARKYWWSRKLHPLEEERLASVAMLVGIEGLLERMPGQLSGGQAQRVALARVLVREPRLVILDEPFAHLDWELRQELREELHLLQRRLGATMILVTHDQDDVLAMADRIGILHEGRLLQVGTLDQVRSSPLNAGVARLLRIGNGSNRTGAASSLHADPGRSDSRSDPRRQASDT